MLSNSTAGEGAPVQAVKQPENGTASTSKEQKCTFFQTNFD